MAGAEADSPPRSTTAVPPPLPPSVEEAYRRKCVQLKNRTNEVEESNDAARLRLSRIKRQVEKLRVERAFLLEQLAKRTSTNVEDSEGSPSPPPTPPAKINNSFSGEAEANTSRKPKEKPLRTKRGHRKADDHNKDGAEGAGADAANEPSEADIAKGAFDLFAKARRADAAEAAANAEDDDKTQPDADADADAEDKLERAWKELADADKEKYMSDFKSSLPPPPPPKKEADEGEADGDKNSDEKKPSSATPTRDGKDKSTPREDDDDKADKENGDEAKDAEKGKPDGETKDKDDDAAAAKPEPQDEDVEMTSNEPDRPTESKDAE
ncbi:HMG protein [Geosmithia morbida]|uniref:HMG protein n=1 Tax=Geosmithia morbida TaxID=1094350 RepID=A0A9P4YTC4_9HYPO|nr:HMG protein [Geosmithia morbida]KAF4121348.1 HMG protein [Geosmithia morbida]